MSSTIDAPTISMNNGEVKTLTFNDNTADAEHQGDQSMNTGGSGGSPSKKANPNKTDCY